MAELFLLNTTSDEYDTKSAELKGFTVSEQLLNHHVSRCRHQALQTSPENALHHPL